LNNLYWYTLYGLIIRSNYKLELFAEISESKACDVDLVFTLGEWPHSNIIEDTIPNYTSNTSPEIELPYLTVWRLKNDFVVRYANKGRLVFYYFRSHQNELKIYYDKEIRFQDVVTYLSGPVMGCLLRVKQKVCLHASVVNIDNQAVVFIGPKTAGKSTLIAAFAKKGFPILSDDLAVLYNQKESFAVYPGYPSLRLWQHTIENVIQLETEPLMPVLSDVNKYYLPLTSNKQGDFKFSSEPLILGRIYFLKERNQDEITSISEYSPLESFLKLQSNIYAEYMLTSELLKKEFEYFGQVLNSCAVKGFDRPDDLQRIDESILSILADLKNKVI